MNVALRLAATTVLSALLVVVTCSAGLAQIAPDKTKKAADEPAPVAGPVVTKIDIEGLRKLIKPDGKPLLINFWATWCDPCREEFPELVDLAAAYDGRIDFVTVSLDDPADADTLVPKFLSQMKALMPAYLLDTPDESAAITMVSKEWRGTLPLTILYAADGGTAYLRNGKIKRETIVSELEKLLPKAVPPKNTD